MTRSQSPATYPIAHNETRIATSPNADAWTRKRGLDQPLIATIPPHELILHADAGGGGRDRALAQPFIVEQMDYLWTPWRYSYISNADEDSRQGVPAELSAWPGDRHCVFCNLIAAADYAVAHGMMPEAAERAANIVLRGTNCFICLNAYPYSSGHVMVVPFAHEASLAALGPEVAHEMIDLAQRMAKVLDLVYRPHGMNLGMNLGKAAGAGVADHLHLHALPRWMGDTNFMTVVGETRVQPEDLATTWEKIREALKEIV